MEWIQTELELGTAEFLFLIEAKVHDLVMEFSFKGRGLVPVNLNRQGWAVRAAGSGKLRS